VTFPRAVANRRGPRRVRPFEGRRAATALLTIVFPYACVVATVSGPWRSSLIVHRVSSDGVPKSGVKDLSTFFFLGSRGEMLGFLAPPFPTWFA